MAKDIVPDLVATGGATEVATVSPGGSGSLQQTQSGGGIPVTGGSDHIPDVLTTANGSVNTSVRQLFATPNIARRAVVVVNCDPAGGEFLYVALHNGVSSTRFRHALAPGEGVSMPAGPAVNVFVASTAGTAKYDAYEEGGVIG